jgi:hypothetical protein
MKLKYTCMLLSLLAGLLSACSSVRPVGKIGDVDIYRATARGVFSPSSTTLIAAPARGAKSVDDLQVLSAAHGPGFVPAVAQAGGIAAGAALLRPSRNSVNSATSATSASTATSTATGNGGSSTGGQFVPPGHINNPSENH